MRTLVLLLASLSVAYSGELHDVARTCNADGMRQVLSKRPPLNELDENGMTPLHTAIDARQSVCIGLLLDAGADRTLPDRKGRTPLHAALEIKDPKEQTLIAYMVKNLKTQDKSEIGQKPTPPWSLEHSVNHRQSSVTQMLLAMGADPNAVTAARTTPLADAALHGDLASVRALLARGARPDAVSKTGTQPIHDAALGNNQEVIRELAKHGADVNALTRDERQTPLHIAASMGKMKAVEALIALGADRTIKDSGNRTPLEAAERAGLTDVVELLKRAGK